MYISAQVALVHVLIFVWCYSVITKRLICAPRPSTGESQSRHMRVECSDLYHQRTRFRCSATQQRPKLKGTLLFYSHKMYYIVLFTDALPCLDIVLYKISSFYLDMDRKHSFDFSMQTLVKITQDS